MAVIVGVYMGIETCREYGGHGRNNLVHGPAENMTHREQGGSAHLVGVYMRSKKTNTEHRGSSAWCPSG